MFFESENRILDVAETLWLQKHDVLIAVNCRIHLLWHPCSRVSFLDRSEMLISKCCAHFDLCLKL